MSELMAEQNADLVADDEPIGRCEWCPEKVWPGQAYLASSGYLWHEECADRISSLLDNGTRYEEAP